METDVRKLEELAALINASDDYPQVEVWKRIEENEWEDLEDHDRDVCSDGEYKVALDDDGQARVCKDNRHKYRVTTRSAYGPWSVWYANKERAMQVAKALDEADNDRSISVHEANGNLVWEN